MTQAEMIKLIAREHEYINDKRIDMENVLPHIELMYGKDSDEYKETYQKIQDVIKVQSGLRLAVGALGIELNSYDEALHDKAVEV